MLYGNDRSALRRQYAQAWRARLEGRPLDPTQALIAAVVAEHPEYHELLAEDALERDFLPEAGQTNPFLHMGLHIAIREQVSTDRPAGIAAVYRALLQRHGDAHRVEHLLGERLGELLWRAQRDGMPADEQRWLAAARALLTGGDAAGL